MRTSVTSILSRRHVGAASGIAVALLGIVVLLSWAAGRWHLLTFGSGFVPTAPSTALLFVLLGGALMTRALRPDDDRADRLGFGLALAVLLLALGVGATPTVGPIVPLEDWLGPPAQRMGGLRVGRMSPLTPLAFVASAGALLLRLRWFAGRDTLRVLAGAFATFVTCLAGVLLVGYAAGAPALYGSGVAPMAVSTAGAFLVSGSATLVLCFREPLPNEASSDERARAIAAVVFVGLVAVMAIAVVMLLRVQLADARHRIVAELNLIVDQKVLAIAEWRNERLSDGSYVSRTPAVAQDVAALLRNPSSASARAGVTRWTSLLGDGRGYAHVYVFDVRRGIRLVFSSNRVPATAVMMAQVAVAARGKDVSLTSIYRGRDDRAHLSVVVRPGALEPSSSRGTQRPAAPTAVVALEVDADRNLYPSVRQWPTRSGTAEILLVERDGRDVVFLTQPRYISRSASLLRRSLSHADLPAARAALGQYEAVDGVDYRGVAVLAVARPVPDSPWKLLAKVDQLEIYAPLRKRALVSGVALAGFAVIAGLALAALWRARELTARAEADALLRESEARFRNVFESANVGKSITMPNGRVHVNAAFAAMLGYAREELDAATWQQLTPPDEIASVQAELAPLLGGARSSARFQKQYVHKDGSSVWADVSTTLQRAADGTPKYFITTIVDITDRVHGELALRRSEERFAAAFQLGPAGSTIFRSADGLIVEANDTFCRLFEFEREEVIGRSAMELGLVTPALSSADSCQESATGGVREVDLRARTKSGRTLDLLVSSQPIAFGGVPHHLTTLVDVTARTHAEASLRESEARFAQAFHSSPIGTFVATLDGTYVDANQAFCDLVGCPRAALIGHRVGVFDNATAALRDCVIAEADGIGGTLQGIEHSIPHVDGSTRHIVFSTTIIDLDGVPHRLSTCQDVTQRKQAEAAVQLMNDELERRIAERTAQLQASNKELEAFAYSVSHDLRAPLRAVDGYMSILQEQYGERMSEEGQRICGIVRQNAQKLGRLIDELLEFSRIGRTELRRAGVDMEALVRSAFQEITTDAVRSRISFTVGALPAVDGDAMLLRTLWVNLLDNAIKFSSRQARAVIEVGCDRGEQATGGAGVASEAGVGVYFVRDNGAGFDMRYVGKLFGMFERLHAEREFAGTGVGLAIVQRIVHRHGGRVWADGVPGAGATFYFTLGGRA
jgi:PAS domain S-box-containing protein